MKKTKRIISKRKGVTALVLTVISLAFMLVGVLTAQPTEGEGVDSSFACWVYSMIVAFVSVFFYALDGLASIGKMFRGICPGFNFFTALLLLGAVPMAIFVGAAAKYTAYWYAYYLLIFFVEIISVAKHKKLEKQRQEEYYEAVVNSYSYMP